MRISDWSSDVCSSDLSTARWARARSSLIPPSCPWRPSSDPRTVTSATAAPSPPSARAATAAPSASSPTTPTSQAPPSWAASPGPSKPQDLWARRHEYRAYAPTDLANGDAGGHAWAGVDAAEVVVGAGLVEGELEGGEIGRANV